MTRSIVACVEDLFFRSKIEATGRHLNVPVRFTEPKELPRAAAEDGTAAVLVELSTDGECFEAVRKLRADREDQRAAGHRVSAPHRPGAREAGGGGGPDPRSAAQRVLRDPARPGDGPGRARHEARGPGRARAPGRVDESVRAKGPTRRDLIRSAAILPVAAQLKSRATPLPGPAPSSSRPPTKRIRASPAASPRSEGLRDPRRRRRSARGRGLGSEHRRERSGGRHRRLRRNPQRRRGRAARRVGDGRPDDEGRRGRSARADQEPFAGRAARHGADEPGLPRRRGSAQVRASARLSRRKTS